MLAITTLVATLTQHTACTDTFQNAATYEIDPAKQECSHSCTRIEYFGTSQNAVAKHTQVMYLLAGRDRGPKGAFSSDFLRLHGLRPLIHGSRLEITVK